MIDPAARPAATGNSVVLLSGFRVVCEGHTIDLPPSAQRLLAFLALHEAPLLRSFVAGTLWSDSSDERAQANLRSALWRLRQPGRALVETYGQRLALAPGVGVDLRDAITRARRLIDFGDSTDPIQLHLVSLSADLLPDWYEDWVLVERERYQQLRVHALEALCARLTEAGRLAEAVESGLAAVAAEPLRESAHRNLIRAYLREGNVGEALLQYRRYRDRLRREVGADPSPQIEELIVELA